MQKTDCSDRPGGENEIRKEAGAAPLDASEIAHAPAAWLTIPLTGGRDSSEPGAAGGCVRPFRQWQDGRDASLGPQQQSRGDAGFARSPQQGRSSAVFSAQPDDVDRSEVAQCRQADSPAAGALAPIAAIKSSAIEARMLVR